MVKAAGIKLDNPYKILGINEYSPMHVVKAAYNNLSMKCHPDINGDTEENRIKFMQITHAYNEVKKDIKKIYDFLEISVHVHMEDFEVACKSKMDELYPLAQSGDEEAAKLHESLKNHYYEVKKLVTSSSGTEGW